MHASRATRFAIAGFSAALLLTTWSIPSGASGPSVPASVVEAQAAKVLAAKTGQQPPRVTCPGDLRGKLGAFINCTLVPKGSKQVYPVRVTINSIRNGTAYFSVQVGQAKGAGNKAKFCSDNAVLDSAFSRAHTGPGQIAILRSHESTIADFQKNAPSQIVVDAGTLVSAGRAAVRSGDASAIASKAFTKAGAAVDAYCGQNADGSPSGSTASTAG